MTTEPRTLRERCEHESRFKVLVHRAPEHPAHESCTAACEAHIACVLCLEALAAERTSQPKHYCHVCENETDMACPDCKVTFGASIYVCPNPFCCKEHEQYAHKEVMPFEPVVNTSTGLRVEAGDASADKHASQPQAAREALREDEDAIKPCPFCGGIGQVREIDDCNDSNFGAAFIECLKCGASTNLQFSEKEDGISHLKERWNARAALKGTQVAQDATTKPVLPQGQCNVVGCEGPHETSQPQAAREAVIEECERWLVNWNVADRDFYKWAQARIATLKGTR